MSKDSVLSQGSKQIPIASSFSTSKSYKATDNFNVGPPIKKIVNAKIVSVWLWLGIFILLAIPFINLIALLIMAFSKVNENLKNFSRAMLLIYLLSFLSFYFFRWI